MPVAAYIGDHDRGTWEVRCTCGWETEADHQTHIWQSAREHHMPVKVLGTGPTWPPPCPLRTGHWTEEPPALQWHHVCNCNWISGWHGVPSELFAAVDHHRKRHRALARRHVG